MIAFGSRASISSTGIECGTISEYTCASRTRRAISCAYCAPRSTTRTGLEASSGPDLRANLVTHPHPLSRLVGLPLGLDRRRDHQLRLLELLDRRVPGRGHRGGQGSEQVEG